MPQALGRQLVLGAADGDVLRDVKREGYAGPRFRRVA